MSKYVDEYRDVDTCLDLSSRIKEVSTRPLTIMEVCGGHTMAIRKNGIQKLVGDNIRLLSGPGCPVCVTSISDIDRVVCLAGEENVTVCTFGDMLYVPGSSMSLAGAKAEGADVRTVYSVHDALEFARSEPEKNFVFVSIGFETTTPTAAAAVLEAKATGVKNFTVLALNKTMPQALRAVLESDDSEIDALIGPGHVSTITGTGMYRFIVDELGVSCCVSGFEPVDLLGAILKLTEMHENNEKGLVNAYPRVVKEEGNEKAKYIMTEVFEPADVEWRGFGIVPSSGSKISEEYSEFDAEKIYKIEVPETKENPACICGDILRGVKRPVDCALFNEGCTPVDPQGACMVSSEGTCAAWFKYGE
ncbi:MAG: hydrogenase formation protein HypD [Candidatus Tantalella remota]|nr:hydrogenase formation protein HypD [Candidatus Tantalella remota]